MRLRHWLFTLPLLALVAPATAFAEQKIGFVDLEYALNNVEEGKKAKAVLEQDYKRKKEDLEATKSTLDKMEADLKSQTLVLSEEARRQKEQDLEAARDRYDADKKAAYEAWQKKEASLTKDLLDRLTTIVQQLGKEGGYTFILERHDASVLYAEGNVDLTSEVIKRFNQSGGKP